MGIPYTFPMFFRERRVLFFPPKFLEFFKKIIARNSKNKKSRIEWPISIEMGVERNVFLFVSRP